MNRVNTILTRISNKLYETKRLIYKHNHTVKVKFINLYENHEGSLIDLFVHADFNFIFRQSIIKYKKKSLRILKLQMLFWQVITSLFL